jgi:metalloendopeptidase OMA1, mitochondrial
VAAFFLPNSRKAETEADVIGVQIAARACYDPAAATSVFEKLERVEKQAGGAAVPRFLRTHPVSKDRIARIREMLPKAEMLSEGEGCETSVEMFRGFKHALGRGRW